MTIVLALLATLVGLFTLMAPLTHAPDARTSAASAHAPVRHAAPTATPPASAKPAAHAPASPPSPTPPAAAQLLKSITLYPGDTLWALAHRYHTTVATLQQINGLGTSTLIYAGHTLRVPADTAHQPAPAAPRRHSAHPAAATSGASPTSTASATAAVAFAKAQLGKPYRWGGTGPYGFDCSGLVMRAWQAGGVQLPRVTYDQARAGTRTTRAALVPGDLVFTEDFGHVELYIGGGQVIYAPRPGAEVTTDRLPPSASVDAYIHISR